MKNLKEKFKKIAAPILIPGALSYQAAVNQELLKQSTKKESILRFFNGLTGLGATLVDLLTTYQAYLIVKHGFENPPKNQEEYLGLVASGAIELGWRGLMSYFEHRKRKTYEERLSKLSQN